MPKRILRGIGLFCLGVCCLGQRGGNGMAMAGEKPFFASDRLDPGLPGSVEIPNLGVRKDGRIYCVFSQNMQAIWIMATSDAGKTWAKPVRVMACPGPGYITDANVLVGPDQLTVYATYVLKHPENKYGNSRFMAAASRDGGATWTAPQSLPIPRRYVVGKVHVPVWLDDKTVVMGYSWDVPAEEEKPADSEGGMFLKSGVLISRDAGQTWTPGADVSVATFPIGAGEPAIARLGNGDLFMVVRTSSQRPYETRSHDGGQTWEEPRPSRFFGYNSPTALLRLRDGTILRAWDNSPLHRYPLVVSLSTDDCRTWSPLRTIAEPRVDDAGQPSYNRACYPSLAEAADGSILAVWWERTDAGVNSLGYARFNRAWVEEARFLPRPQTIVAFGDSVTAGARPGVTEFQTFRSLLERRLKAEGRSVQVVNAGVGGHNSRDALARLERDVLAPEPALVVVMFGINDAAMIDAGPKARAEPRVPLPEYRKNLEEIIARLRAKGIRVVLCTPNPMTPAYPYARMGAYADNDINFQLVHYVDAVRAIARAQKLPLVDLFRLFQERPDGLQLIEDGCHPYVTGHRLIAEALYAPVRDLLPPR